MQRDAHPVRAASVRRAETPNATMTTLASPSLGGTEELSLWEVEMQSGSRGPVHTFDSEQVWTVRAGEVSIVLEGSSVALRTGDTLALPAFSERQVIAVTHARLLVCGRAGSVVSVPGEDAPRGTPSWIS